jgi:hypothetical protein
LEELVEAEVATAAVLEVEVRSTTGAAEVVGSTTGAAEVVGSTTAATVVGCSVVSGAGAGVEVELVLVEVVSAWWYSSGLGFSVGVVSAAAEVVTGTTVAVATNSWG